MRLLLVAVMVAAAALACSGDGDAPAPASEQATQAASPLQIPPVRDFVLSDDADGAGVWHLGEPLAGVVVGPLCSALGGGVELLVNGRGVVEARTLGGRFVGITRAGAWVLWLPDEVTQALPRQAPPLGADAQLVARAADRVSVEAGGAYLRCK